MKIAFIISHINSSMQWVWFSEELKKRNIEHIYILINETPPHLIEKLKNLDIEVHYLPHRNFLYFIKNFFVVSSILIGKKINLVHTEMPYGNLVGQTSAWFCRIKMRVTTCENTSWAFDFNSKKQEFIDRLTFRLAKRVIALTDEALAFLKIHFNIADYKLSIIHHSLKSEDYLFQNEKRIEDLKKKLDITPDMFIIGMVARFEFWKGHIYAIEAFEKLTKEYPNIRLLIFGSKGESFETVINSIREKNLQDKIMYKGFVSDNIALFRLFDIHLHIPIKKESETFGINIMEGMISGCAQVLTLSGISCFTAKNEENCLVVPYTSTEAVYTALKRMIIDPELRKRLGNRAKEDALKYFQYSEKVQRHINLYTELSRELNQ